MIIAVTGCPGSGKSVLSREIADHGWELVDVDDLGRTVVEDDAGVLAALAAAFGEDILLGDGSLDRRLLAGRAFASREANAALNWIVHPPLIRRLERRIGELRRDGADAVVDCALVFEWGIGGRFDLVICVAADEETRKRRLMSRDGRSESEVHDLFAAQFPEPEKIRRADLVLNNTDADESMIRRFGALLAEAPRFFPGE